MQTRKIERDYRRAFKKLNDIDAFIYTIEQNPNCTIWEFGRGILRALGLSSIAKDDFAVRQIMAEKKQQINSDAAIDEHIIAVPHELTDSYGEQYKISCIQLAKTRAAIEASNRCAPYIRGWKNKQVDLNRIGNDEKYATLLNMRKKRRELQVNS